jgi:tetratricopeptide (TPR) repeat protein
MLAGSVFVATVAAFTTRLALEAEATRTALNATEIERDRAQRVATFLSELFRAGDTTQSGGQALSAQELLDRARHAMAGNPELPAPSRLLLLNTLAEVYRNLGRYAESEQLLREAQQWLPQQRSPLMQAETLENLGIVYELSGQSKRARSVLTEALSLLEQAEHADQDARARVSERLATSLQSLGEHEAAGALFERAWAARRSLAVNDPRRAESALRYGSWHWVAGRFEQAAEFYAMALATRRAEQPANLPELARTLDAVAAAKHAQGNLAAALPLYAESLELRRRVLGEKHRLTADSLSNIGALHVDRGTPQDAIAPLQEALGIYAQVLPADSVVPAKTHNNLGLALHAQKSWDQAEEHFKRALALNRASYGPEHPRVAGNLNNLALVFEQRQHMAEAERALSQALQILERAQGASHVGLAFPLTNMGRIALWRNQLESARNLLERALKIRRQALPQAHRLLADTLFWLALTRCAEGEQASGLVALNEAQQSYLAHRDQEAITDVAAVRAVCQPDYAWPAAEREAWQQRRGQHDPLVAWVQTRLQ